MENINAFTGNNVNETERGVLYKGRDTKSLEPIPVYLYR